MAKCPVLLAECALQRCRLSDDAHILFITSNPDLLQLLSSPAPPVKGSGHKSTLCSSNCIDLQRSPKAN